MAPDERPKAQTRAPSGASSPAQSRASWQGGPLVILARPQMGENIGAAARAMYNFGLDKLRITSPRDGWPNDKALAMAAGAASVVEAAEVFDDLPAAVADLNYVVASSARGRDLAKPILSPEEAARALRAHHAAGEKVGMLFGAERSGLANEEVALADAVVTIPANPAFPSLNLGQAVLLLSYEWMRTSGNPELPRTGRAHAPQAAKAELIQLFEALEEALIHSGFLMSVEKRPAMILNLRSMLSRAELTEQEVRTLRGIIVSLARSKPK